MLSTLIKVMRASLSSISARLVIIDNKTPQYGRFLGLVTLSAGASVELYDFTGANLQVHKILISGVHTGGAAASFIVSFRPDGGGGSSQFWTPRIPANSEFNLELSFPRILYWEDPGDIDVTSPADVTGGAYIYGYES